MHLQADKSKQRLLSLQADPADFGPVWRFSFCRNSAPALYIFGSSGNFPFALGPLLFAAGFYLLYYKAAPIVFDKGSGLFVIGWKRAGRVPDRENPKNVIDLDSVYALQLISKIIYRKTPYLCYDLNLVLKNGKRIAVLSHANKNKIRDDTLILADFLDKPLWEAID